jgi:hypothetical protein
MIFDPASAAIGAIIAVALWSLYEWNYGKFNYQLKKRFPKSKLVEIPFKYLERCQGGYGCYCRDCMVNPPKMFMEIKDV